MTYPTLVRGTSAWLYDLIQAQLGTINTELTSGIKAEGPVPTFSVNLGDPLEPQSPVIGICYYGSSRDRIGQHEYLHHHNYVLLVLIPRMGDDTSANYEMSRLVAADNLMCLFTDETATLTPAVSGGPLGTVHAWGVETGDLVDIDPRILSDGKSYVWGFEFPVSISFALQSHP